MAPKLSKLAKQYKKALDELQAAQEAADAARGPWLEEATAARDELLDELLEFAEASGLRVGRGTGSITLAHHGRALTISHGTHGDTLQTDALARIVLAPDGVWMVETDDSREPLVDRGLRKLLTLALDVPDPEGEFAPSAKAAPAKVAAPEKTSAKPAKAAKAAAAERPVSTITVPDNATASETGGSGPPEEREYGHLGRSGTRGFRRSKDVPPGGVIKDLKGPGPV